MNKAEEQYQYRLGRVKAQFELMNFAQNITKRHSIESIKEILEGWENSLEIEKISFAKGISDYNSETLRAINCNVITDWPSFVTYMTGETYETEPMGESSEVKCIQCGSTLNELMIGRWAQPHREIPVVLCESCCQASPDCVNCKGKDCEGYVKDE